MYPFHCSNCCHRHAVAMRVPAFSDFESESVVGETYGVFCILCNAFPCAVYLPFCMSLPWSSVLVCSGPCESGFMCHTMVAGTFVLCVCGRVCGLDVFVSFGSCCISWDTAMSSGVHACTVLACASAV